jgi:uncharacterized protein with beta-barrel porin domain
MPEMAVGAVAMMTVNSRVKARVPKRSLHLLVLCASLASIAGPLAMTPAQAQVQCTSSSSSDICTNTGSTGNNGPVANIQVSVGVGTASLDNSGTMGNNNGNTNIQTFVGAGDGTATLTNSGSMGNNNTNASIETFVNGNGTATLTNSGTMGNNNTNASIEAFVNGNGTATLTNFGTMGNNNNFANVEAFVGGNGTATITNLGSIGNNATTDTNIQTFVQGNGTATLTNLGSMGNNGTNDTNIQAFVQGNGTATLTNLGSMGNGASGFINIETSVQGNGTATLTNAGMMANGFTGTGMVIEAFVGGNGTATLINAGTMATGGTGTSRFIEALVTGNGTATIINGGTMGNGVDTTVLARVTGSGTASIINSGIIGGAVTVFATTGTADLTNTAGSLIVGSITLTAPTKILEFVGGNYVYTLTSMAGVQVNAHGAPFVVSGNTVAVLDPTGFALADRSVMNFTGGVSSMLQDRFGGMSTAGAGVGSAMPANFAPETAASDRINAAHDAFAGMPSLSMSYASDDSKANAQAMYTKAPLAAVPVNDITVWSSGFGGEQRQSAYDNVQRARNDAFGGAIGVDRQFTPDWRFGLFAGGGSSRLRTDFNVQNVDSDYGFGGGYGRYDRHTYYVDFALFGGGISSRSTRQVANNLVGFQTATASYNGWFISPDVTAGYRVFTDWGTITPKARVRYVGGTLDGYTETGSAQGLTVGARDLSDAEERLGVEIASTKPAIFGWGTLTVRSELDAVGLQRLGDNTINAVLLAQNIAFTTPGKARAYGGAASSTFDWRPQGNVSLYLSAEGTAMDDHSYSVVGKGGVRVGF